MFHAAGRVDATWFFIAHILTLVHHACSFIQTVGIDIAFGQLFTKFWFAVVVGIEDEATYASADYFSFDYIAFLVGTTRIAYFTGIDTLEVIAHESIVTICVCETLHRCALVVGISCVPRQTHTSTIVVISNTFSVSNTLVVDGTGIFTSSADADAVKLAI